MGAKMTNFCSPLNPLPLLMASAPRSARRCTRRRVDRVLAGKVRPVRPLVLALEGPVSTVRQRTRVLLEAREALRAASSSRRRGAARVEHLLAVHFLVALPTVRDLLLCAK